jgi:serine/threonine-protein kinase
MLAAAAETEALPLRRALPTLAVVVAGLLVFAGVAGRTSILGRVPLDKPPAVLIDRAEQIVASLGYADPPRDWEYGLMLADDYIDWLRNTRIDAHRWDVLPSGSPPAVVFWYRTSPRAMTPESLDYTIDVEDPPLAVTDMRLVVLDTRGRLQQFRSVPPQKDLPPLAESPRWDALFDAAGLPMSAFSEVSPAWTPPDFADVRKAWEGRLPDRADLTVRVEAAAYGGRPIWFSVVGPWTQTSRMGPEHISDIDRVANAVLIILLLALLVAAILLARHNVRTGRADRRGAASVGVFIIASGFAVGVIAGHHAGSVDGEFESLLRVAAIYILVAAAMCVIYLALEPYVRKFWPDSLLGWSRLIAGHVRDPRVGRDVLTGAAFGVAMTFVALGRATVLPQFGFPAQLPRYGEAVNVVTRGGKLIAAILGGGVGALEGALLTVLVFVVLRLVLRRASLAIAVGIVLMTLVVVRCGLLATIAALYFSNAVTNLPLRLDFAHWAGTPSLWALLVFIAMAFFAFSASRAGQPLFGRLLND